MKSLVPVLSVLALASCSRPGGCGSTAALPPVADAVVAPGEAVASASDAGDGDPLMERSLVTFPSGALVLHGFLWRPKGAARPAGPAPVVVFNHGSERLPGWAPDLATFFVHRGYVLFVPHRRGQGRSHDVGPYLDELDGGDDAIVETLDRQRDDVLAAIAWVRAQPDVNPRAVAVVGCSFGGIETLYAAERSPDVVAAVDFAGGAMSWRRSPLLRDRLRSAATHAQAPVFFLQAENDYDTRPSIELAAAMQDAGKPEEMKIYPANGATPEEGHAFCHGGANPPWGEDVLAFLAANGAPPLRR